jgi:hypothetical protein
MKQFRTPADIPAGCLVAPSAYYAPRPGAKAVGGFENGVYYQRKDVSELKSKTEWQRLGRKIKNGQKPLAVRGGPEPMAVFADWQTE